MKSLKIFSPKVYTLTTLVMTIILGSLIFINSQASLPNYDSQGNALPTLAPMLEKITDAVVNVSTMEGTIRVVNRDKNSIFDQPLFQDPLLNRFLEQFKQFQQYDDDNEKTPPSTQQKNLGSGVIINANKGYVLTNNHVIEHADKILITLKDGRKLEAELIGSDKKTDIALLKIPAKNLTDIPLANSDKLRVGDFAVAIGNPFGLGQTVTSGIISALGRTGLGIEGYEDFIQTDASINPGNSGGALVNLRGELIGINTAILSKHGGNVGIGFAIPVNMVNSITEQLLEHGQVKRGLLGVHIQDLTPDLADALNIKQSSGAIIANVMKNSAAERAGLKNGDVIIQANNKSINTASNLRNFVGLLRPGEKIRFQVVRENKQFALTATISGDDELLISQTDFNAKDLHPSLDGAVFSEDPQTNQVKISELVRGSVAWSVGLKVGDHIVAINHYKVSKLSDLKNLSKRNLHRIAINIQRGDTGLYLVLE
ncbi:MAG: Do family serine endopeptidase [Gammaproteobacteria bacterium]|nr:Do family serine endopeptidase [Gammaproteobacteria bacterium]